MASSLRSLLLAAATVLAALLAPARAGLPTAVTDLVTCARYAQQLRSGNIQEIENVCQPDVTAVIERCVDEASKICLISQLQAEAVTVNLESVCDLPSSDFAYLPALFRCGQYVEMLKTGDIPPGACEAETLATIKRCLQVAVRIGEITRAESNALNDALDAACRLLPG